MPNIALVGGFAGGDGRRGGPQPKICNPNHHGQVVIHFEICKLDPSLMTARAMAQGRGRVKEQNEISNSRADL